MLYEVLLVALSLASTTLFPCFLSNPTTTYTPPLLHLDSVVESASTLYVHEREGESERSHPSLALTPPDQLHTINRNWDRHTFITSHTAEREGLAKEREQWGSILSLSLSLFHRLTQSVNVCHEGVRFSWRALRHPSSTLSSPPPPLRLEVSRNTHIIFVLCCSGFIVHLSSSAKRQAWQSHQVI